MSTERYYILNSEVDKLLRFFECWENIEVYFNIDISCGDGLFMSDINGNESLVKKYAGKTDIKLVKRKKTNKILKGELLFSFCYNFNFQENGKPEFYLCSVRNID